MRIVFEDESILAVSKPAGLKVHGGNFEASLERLVKERLGRRAILLHRLDQETTGLVLLAKRKDVAGQLSRAFEERRIRKTYFAVVEGRWDRRINRVESMIEKNGQDRKALTTFRVLSVREDRSWLEAIPKTGRRHQIRIHCASQGHAICGDSVYGHGRPGEPLALHAWRLDFQHPLSKRQIQLTDRPPEAWRDKWLVGFDTDRVFT